MHTPDTEGRNRVHKKGVCECCDNLMVLLSSRDTYWNEKHKENVKYIEKLHREQTILDLARVREERDTYWKERVRKEVEGVKRKFANNYEAEIMKSAYLLAKHDILKALDNLK